MVRKIILTLAAVVFLTLAHPSAAAERLVIGVENQDYRPYYWIEAGEFQSAAREILDVFAEERNIEFVFRPMPVNRLFKEFLAGNLDFKFPDNPNWKKDVKEDFQIAYSAPLLNFIDGVMVRPDRLGQGLDSLKVLGSVLGFTPVRYLEHIEAGRVKLIENASINGLLEQVILGRIDGAYVNPEVAGYQLKHALKKPGALAFDPELPHLKGSYLISSIKHPDLIEDFNNFLGQAQVEVTTIKARHGIE